MKPTTTAASVSLLLSIAAVVALVAAPGHVEASEASIRTALLTLMDVLDAHDYNYWPDFGTLLGAYRDKDIAPGDDDADLAMWSDDFESLVNAKKVRAELREKGYVLARSKNNVLKLYPIDELKSNNIDESEWDDAYCSECTNVDVFGFAKESKCAVRSCPFMWKQPCGGISSSSTPIKYLSNFKKLHVPKWKRDVQIPVNTPSLLEYRYGSDYMTNKPGSKSLLKGC
eukprot:TRINITY_DN67507_c7_g8_i2.p1 TRINITY_DN67507_c7_g8~~TRINITY_DN67507_c7_g8_i2.p1  ORF type:complete len:240 (+),score=134.34 TRINITY_DN67507_c7_g8_i2:37-720(+)